MPAKEVTGPHLYRLEQMEALIRRSVLLRRTDVAEVGYHQPRRGFGEGCKRHLVASHQTKFPCRAQVRNEDPHDWALTRLGRHIREH